MYRPAQTPADTRRLLLAVLLLLIASMPASSQTWRLSTWTSHVDYRLTFSAPAAEAGTLAVAAVDSYTVFLNGDSLLSATTWTRVHERPVQLQRGTNHVALRVHNRGQGVGNGLVLSIRGDSLGRVTSTTDGRTQWRFAAGPQENAWITRDVRRDAAWQSVQSGHVDTEGLSGATAAIGDAEWIAGFPGGIDLGSEGGVLQLRPLDGHNLARSGRSRRDDVLDGNPFSSWAPPVNALNYTADIDLGSRYVINEVRVVTAGSTPQQLADNALLGYSIQVSDDEIRWSEVAVVRDVQDLAGSKALFDAVSTRFVRLVVVQINAVTQPRVGEIEVYGEGFARTASYTSPIVDLGADLPKNLGAVRWEAQTPEGSVVELRLRTGAHEQEIAEALWSDPVPLSGNTFAGREPVRFLQARIDLSSHNPRQSPRFRSLEIDWDTTAVAAARLSGSIEPRRVPMAVDTTLVYTLDVEIDSTNSGVERLMLDVPAPAHLESVEGATLGSWSSTHDALTLRFDPPVAQTTRIRIAFRARTYATTHTFRAAAFSTSSAAPLHAGESTVADETTGQPRGWSLAASTSLPATLLDVRANPAILTPNGDGHNDATVIEFSLAKLTHIRPVTLRIVDLSGRLIVDRTLPGLVAGSYLRTNEAAATLPGFWDGRNDRGDLVAPGLYLYSVTIDLDGGSETATGTIAVAY